MMIIRVILGAVIGGGLGLSLNILSSKISKGGPT